MSSVPLQLTLVRSFTDSGMRYRVLAHRLEDDPASSNGAGHEVGAVELNRRIELPNGVAYSIARRGSLLAPIHVLVPVHSSDAKAPVLATLRRERIGLWWQRVLTLAGPTDSAEPTQRFLLHRRAVFGSPANADLLGDVPSAQTVDLAKLPVVLRVEKVGAWRQRLQARWLDSARLTLPVVMFVLSLLADEDHRAAIAASAGVAGV